MYLSRRVSIRDQAPKLLAREPRTARLEDLRFRIGPTHMAATVVSVEATILNHVALSLISSNNKQNLEIQIVEREIISKE